MASDRERWIDIDFDDEGDDEPEVLSAVDEDEEDVELHGQFFE